MADGYQTTGERTNTGTGAGLDTGGEWTSPAAPDAEDGVLVVGER